MANLELKVSRKFYYYDYDIERFDNNLGSTVKYDGRAKSDVITEIFQHIKSLRYVKDDFSKETLIWKNKDGNYVYILVDEESDKHIFFKIILSKDKLLPYTDSDGVIEPLAKLFKNEQKLAEITHCIFFKKENIFSAEYNFSGGKMKDLKNYIFEKVDRKEVALFEIYNRVNIDTLKKIKKNEEMSLLDINVRAGAEIISELIKEDPLFKALDCNLDNVMEVALRLKTPVTKKKAGFFVNIMPESIAEIFKKHKQDVKKFKIKYGYGMEEIDLLSENFVYCDKFIPIENTKTINKEDAYKAMIKYFDNEVQKYID